MAVSGSIDFNDTRSQIITDALLLLNVIGLDESPTTNETNLVARHLNRMIKEWQARNIYLWTLTEATLFLREDVASYDLYSSGDHASDTIVSTTLSAAEASGQTILSITDTTGMNATDPIGIELDDDTRQWTTIASVDSSTQITVDAALTGDAASGNTVYSYTTILDKPFQVLDVRRRDDAGYDKPLREMNREEYFNLVDKTSQGDVSNWYYDRQRDKGVLYVWPAPYRVKDTLKITYKRILNDMDAAGDNPDFPQEWLDCIVYNLALRIAPSFGKGNSADMPLIERQAREMLLVAMSFDQDITDVNFYMDDAYVN